MEERPLPWWFAVLVYKGWYYPLRDNFKNHAIRIPSWTNQLAYHECHTIDGSEIRRSPPVIYETFWNCVHSLKLTVHTWNRPGPKRKERLVFQPIPLFWLRKILNFTVRHILFLPSKQPPGTTATTYDVGGYRAGYRAADVDSHGADGNAIGRSDGRLVVDVRSIWLSWGCV